MLGQFDFIIFIFKFVNINILKLLLMNLTFLITNDSLINILFYVFIGIFVLTAFLTLLSLPGWVKIDQWYQKKLFLALILEVVGVVVTLFGDTFYGSDNSKTYAQTEAVLKKMSDTPNTWLDNKGLNMYFDIITRNRNNDTTNTVTQTLTIDQSTIKDMELFNSITLNDFYRESSAILKFRRDPENNNRWYHKEGEIKNCPFKCEVYDASTGANYKITQDSDIKFDSYGPKTFDVFNKYNRRYIILSYRDSSNNDKLYYLYRVTGADLENSSIENQFIDIFLIEIKSVLETKQI